MMMELSDLGPGGMAYRPKSKEAVRMKEAKKRKAEKAFMVGPR
jgi:hypothetical protein